MQPTTKHLISAGTKETKLPLLRLRQSAACARSRDLMKRPGLLGCVKVAVLTFALHQGVQALPNIIATNVQGTSCAVSVTLDPTTYSSFTTTLTYTFVAGANQISFSPPNPPSGSPTNPLSFLVPPGTYTLWITVGPYNPGNSFQTSSKGYIVTVAPCPLSR